MLEQALERLLALFKECWSISFQKIREQLDYYLQDQERSIFVVDF
jgi:hypothetical protein